MTPRMSYEGFDLSPTIRAAASAELQADLTSGSSFKSNRVRADAMPNYFNRLAAALDSCDDLWLIDQFRANNCIVRPKYLTKTGKYLTTPKNAEEVLGLGEFKRYCVRGVCLDALARGVPDLEYYRARESMIHRAESDMLVGTTVTAEVLLALSREMTDGEPYSGPPCEFGSGLSVRISKVLEA